MEKMEKRFKRTIGSLEDIFTFLSEFKKRSKIDNSAAYGLDLIVEELFTNMVKYNSEGSLDILISLERAGNKLVLVFNDYGGEPFDITKIGEVNTKQRLEERKVGGLGIHLVKHIADQIDFEYHDQRSKITVMKKLEE